MKFLYLIFLFLLTFQTHTVCATTQLETLFQNTNIIHVSFLQTKILPELDQPFISNGELYFEKEKGLVWHQLSPENKKFIATPTTYCLDNQHHLTQDLPYFDKAKQATDKFLSGDLTALEDLFQTKYTELSPTTWQLKLTPNQDKISEFIKDIHVNGTSKNIKNIHILYKNDSTLIIEFTPISKEQHDEIDC